jgi:Protein of unknown function (DUF1592)/Protein of unknown function (DUF1588)/Protein of unknown function (DUF1587)/Protein of unknown function (DUF1595)/Protein of unknown function (DUF1585)
MRLWLLHSRNRRWLADCVLSGGLLVCHSALVGGEPPPPSLHDDFRQLVSKYCADCHHGAKAEARLDLAALCEPTGVGSLADHFSEWRRVSRALVDRSMPPKDSDPLPDIDRHRIIDQLEKALHETLSLHSNDPGETVLRRLTSAEFDYCIEDLTGLKLHLGEQFVSDSVGGSGFTNSATAQFMQDATLERYLEAARRIADHAMIGAGPVYFYQSPHETGLELSAADRIQNIYRRYGFRSAAGEGAQPFGLERFATAFQVAWQFRYHHELGLPGASLPELARRANLETKFAAHIWEVMQRTEAPFPLSDIIERWQKLPTPQQLKSNANQSDEQQIAQLSQELSTQMQSWQTRFAGSASAEEEAAVLADGHVSVPGQASFVARALRKRKAANNEFTPDLNNAKLYSDDGRVRLKVTVEPASKQQVPMPVVIFSNPKFRFRVADTVQPEPVPLSSVLDNSSAQKLRFGENPGGEALRADEFALPVGESLTLEVVLPDDCRLGELQLEARLDKVLGRNSVVRCVIEDVTSPKGKSFSSLLRDSDSRVMDEWEAGLAEFARCLPQVSHREPVPSDRDPIPAPYNNVYNLPERNFFHTNVKYHRDDRFLREHLLPEEATRELESVWIDLLTAFDYHDVNVRFVCNKYGIPLKADWHLSIDAPWLKKIDEIPRQHITRFLSEKQAMRTARAQAETEHLQNVIDIATRAWRRPLSALEAQELKDFYLLNREQHGLAHAAAIRACLVRILVSPDFLFRIEQPSPNQQQPTLAGHDLTSHELANRLSFSLWSSVPDDELRQLADRGTLHDEQVLVQQVRRMLTSPKSRRMSTEFFGQWLGFYQFDRFRGVDARRFPEFDERLQQALYDEAINFCAHIIQSDLPYRDLLSAETTFIDKRAAEHYGIPWEASWESPNQLTQIRQFHRGGIFGLGAILTSTSAPLRTSPVKRGDWILRRILGTPVPPPPADVGSIPAEEVLADGLTARQRLEAHRNQEACMNCHVRIDPLGFTLEHFDSLGRWREAYSDGSTIDATGQLANGNTISGLDGLRAFLTESDELFRRTFATKLVAYCLGRTETIADAWLVEKIAEQWKSDPRFSTAVITIIKSPQFRKIRAK